VTKHDDIRHTASIILQNHLLYNTATKGYYNLSKKQCDGFRFLAGASEA